MDLPESSYDPILKFQWLGPSRRTMPALWEPGNRFAFMAIAISPITLPCFITFLPKPGIYFQFFSNPAHCEPLVCFMTRACLMTVVATLWLWHSRDCCKKGHKMGSAMWVTCLTWVTGLTTYNCVGQSRTTCI